MAAEANEKYDVKREHPELYAPSAKEFAIVDVPPMRYLAVDGHGDPNTAARTATPSRRCSGWRTR